MGNVKLTVDTLVNSDCKFSVDGSFLADFLVRVKYALSKANGYASDETLLRHHRQPFCVELNRIVNGGNGS